MMSINIDYDTITAFGKTVLRNFKSSMEETTKVHKEIIDYEYPETHETIKMRLKTSFNTVNPKYWVDSSGMKFDNEQKDFYGFIPGTSIRTALRGTWFWVEDNKYHQPTIDEFVKETLVRSIPTKEYNIFQYDIALSFAGEDREIVEKVAEKLKENNINVFYDKYYKAELWGKDLSDHFKKIYGGKTSNFVIIFISRHYVIKDWTNFEFEIAKGEAEKRKDEFILPIRLDDTLIQGISRNIAYINFYKEGLEGVIEIVLKKIGKK